MLGAWYRMSGSAIGLGSKLCLDGNAVERNPPFSVPVVQADAPGVLYEVSLVVYDFAIPRISAATGDPLSCHTA